VPVTAALRRAYLRNACRASKAANLPLDEYLEGVQAKNPALTGRPLIQSSSYGGQSSSYFTPGEDGGMTPSDQAELIELALEWLPCIEASLEDELGRPPTHDEICAALISSVLPGLTEVRNDYSALRSGCGCF